MQELIDAMALEKENLDKLLNLLSKQYLNIISKNMVELDRVSKEIEVISKIIAQIEIDRRKLQNGKKIKDIVTENDNEALNNIYKEIKIIVNNISIQKETNDLLAKQELFYANKIISAITPNQKLKTYNSSGNIKT